MGLPAEVHISESSSIVHPSGAKTVWNIASPAIRLRKLINAIIAVAVRKISVFSTGGSDKLFARQMLTFSRAEISRSTSEVDSGFSYEK